MYSVQRGAARNNTMNQSPKRPRDLGSALASLEINESTTTFNKENIHIDHVIADIHAVLTTRQRLAVLNRLHKSLQQPGDASFHTALHPAVVASSSTGNHQSFPMSRRSGSSNPSHVYASRLINAGIINALALQLHHLIRSHGSTLAELELICHCIVLLLTNVQSRSQPDVLVLQQLILEQGSEFVALVTEAASVATSKRHHRAFETAKSSVLTIQHSVIHIFHLVSSFGSGAILLLRCRAAIEAIICILGNREMSDDIVAQSLGIWKNLTYFEEASRLHLMKTKDFVFTLTALPSRSLSLKSRQRLSSILRNLVISMECRSLAVGQPAVLTAMVKLMTWEPEYPFGEITTGNAEATRKDVCRTQRNLLTTLISLSMDCDSTLLLIFHGDGVLLSILKRYLQYSDDTVVRKRSASALRLLANPSSAPLLIHDAGLMHVLSDTALRDESSEVRREATEAFARCAALVQVDQQPHYCAVLDALTGLATTQRNRPNGAGVSVSILARALKEQSCHLVNRRPMAERSILLTTLAQIALSREFGLETAVQDACCALEYLSMEPFNLWRLAQHPTILDALLANSTNPMIPHNQLNSAMTTIVNLSGVAINRPILARHPCLLQTLILVARSVPKELTTVQAKLRDVVLLLVKEL